MSRVGRFVRWASDAETPACAGTVGQLDHFIESIFADLEEPPPDEPFVTYYWMPDHLADTPCDGLSEWGCAHGSRQGVSAYSIVPDHFHELAHAVHLYLFDGVSARYLDEAFAHYYGDSFTEAGNDGAELAQLAIAPSYDERPFAIKLFSDLRQRYGVGVVKQLMRAVRRGSDAEQRFAEVVGAKWARAVEMARETKRCGALLPRCSAPLVMWEEVRRGVQIMTGCDDADVFGPMNGGFTSRSFTVDVPAAGDYELEYLSEDYGIDHNVRILRCAPCGGYVDHFLIRPWVPSVHLAAGIHLVEVLTTGQPRPVEVTIRPSSSSPAKGLPSAFAAHPPADSCKPD